MTFNNKKPSEGRKAEIELVQILNQKENKLLWDNLVINKSNVYAIHVIKQKPGKINQRKIYPKADIFLARGSVKYSDLNKNNFYLNEDHYNTYNLKYISKSGISVKNPKSKNYQIIKMSPEVFGILFKINELGAGASIYCSKESDILKNSTIINKWHSNTQKFNQYFSNKLNININEINKIKNLKQIKTFSNNQIHKIITSNKYISDFVFKGIGNFEEPYTAYFIFENNKLKKNHEIPFNITTGSGRSKGIYTIVVKPR